jgi:hypothetical protein
MKIRTKIIVIIFLTVLITGITAITVSQTISKDMLRRKISNHLETTAESRARLVKAFLDKEKKLVLQMSES